jgi:hypothetical protein
MTTRAWRNGIAATLAALALAAALPAQAITDEDIEDAVRNPTFGTYRGYAEFKMAHYEAAQRIWEALAARGSAEAMFNLGILHEDGLGVQAEPARAIELYEQAANAGSRAAAYRLGVLYESGGRVPADRSKAAFWLGRAAGQGDADAAARLARLQTAGTEESPRARAERLDAAGRGVEAAALYRELALAGDMRAASRLAWMHEAGRGVTRDLAAAARLFRRAAEAGEAEAQYALSVMLRTGVGQPRDATQADQWLARAAAQGHPQAAAALQAAKDCPACREPAQGPRIAVLDFELLDLTLTPNQPAELARSADAAPALREALAARGLATAAAASQAQAAADKAVGYLFDHPDVAADLGAAQGAQWVAVGRLHKPSDLFAYLQVQLVDVCAKRGVGSFSVEIKGQGRKLLEQGAARLAEQLAEAVDSLAAKNRASAGRE